MRDAQWRKSRNVVERIVITGQLVLDTPAHFGNGDASGLTDIALARDSLDGQSPLLTGASIAGALRNYLREYQRGYSQNENQDGKSLAEQLFGHLNHQRESTVQSWLMVDDAIGTASATELREGVAIDPRTRAAEDRKKYDIELLAAGATFPLRFELWVSQKESGEKRQELLDALVVALRGLEGGEIGLGTRKRRGYGQCHVEDWRTVRYDLSQDTGLLAWLTESEQNAQAGLPSVSTPCADARREWRLAATFGLASSLLIRSDSGDPNDPDMVQLRSKRPRNEEPVPILSGTSLTGVLRGRALRIANTLYREDRQRAVVLVDTLFGRRITPEIEKLSPEDPRRQPTGSRMLVREAEIKGGLKDRVQSRVKIDHLTGGAFPGGLFSQQPLWNIKTNPARIEVEVRLRRPGVDPEALSSLPENDYQDVLKTAVAWLEQTHYDMTPEKVQKPQEKIAAQIVAEMVFQAQAGMVLLALKDLWTGDLPLGGESSVGRGRLAGQEAAIVYGGQTWQLRGADSIEVSGPAAQLEDWVQAFVALAQRETTKVWLEQYLSVKGGVA